CPDLDPAPRLPRSKEPKLRSVGLPARMTERRESELRGPQWSPPSKQRARRSYSTNAETPIRSSWPAVRARQRVRGSGRTDSRCQSFQQLRRRTLLPTTQKFARPDKLDDTGRNLRHERESPTDLVQKDSEATNYRAYM